MRQIMLAMLFAFHFSAFGKAVADSQESIKPTSASSDVALGGTCAQRALAIKSYIIKERKMWDIMPGRLQEWTDLCLSRQSNNKEMNENALKIKNAMIEEFKATTDRDKKDKLSAIIQKINAAVPQQTAEVQRSGGTAH